MLTRKMRRTIAATALSIGALGVGASGAWAWTWAASSSPLTVSYDGLTRGGGYGDLNYVSFGQGRLVSYLSDSRTDSMRTFVDVYGDLGNYDLSVQSGRRSDGGTTYAKMADKDFYSSYPYGVQQYFYYTKVCMDRNLASDPCSKTVTHSGL